jgi:ketosteroid isomerase-like protein
VSGDDLARRFIAALEQLEAGDGADGLAALYADDAVSGNVATSRTYDGPDGAREFWTGYRSTFDRIASEFRTVTVSDDSAALEWRSTGTLTAGDDVDYEGVTVLELRDGRIVRSTAYFDPNAIVSQLSGRVR